MSEGHTVKGAVVNSNVIIIIYMFISKFLTNTPLYENKDTENDASKAGRYGHSWVTLSGNGDVRKTVCERQMHICACVRIIYTHGVV